MGPKMGLISGGYGQPVGAAITRPRAAHNLGSPGHRHDAAGARASSQRPARFGDRNILPMLVARETRVPKRIENRDQLLHFQ